MDSRRLCSSFRICPKAVCSCRISSRHYKRTNKQTKKNGRVLGIYLYVGNVKNNIKGKLNRRNLMHFNQDWLIQNMKFIPKKKTPQYKPLVVRHVQSPPLSLLWLLFVGDFSNQRNESQLARRRRKIVWMVIILSFSLSF